MREYTGDRVFQALRAGYASNPDITGLPGEPPSDEYARGAVPLQTLPAPYWNWFISSISNNDPRTADVFDDIYGEFDAILTQASLSPTGNPGDIYNALKTLWSSDIAALGTNVQNSQDELIENFLKVTTDDGWKMFTAAGGYYSWVESTGMLSYCGPGPEDSGNDDIKWIMYTIVGGAEGYDTTGGTRLGVRSIWAEDSSGVVRFYYTYNRTDFTFTDNDEIITQQVAQNIIAQLSGGLKPPIIIPLESGLPTSGQQVGDNYVILEMDITWPGFQGQAWWTGGPDWQRMKDTLHQPDDVTITLNSEGQLQLTQEWQNNINDALIRATGLNVYETRYDRDNAWGSVQYNTLNINRGGVERGANGTKFTNLRSTGNFFNIENDEYDVQIQCELSTSGIAKVPNILIRNKISGEFYVGVLYITQSILNMINSGGALLGPVINTAVIIGQYLILHRYNNVNNSNKPAITFLIYDLKHKRLLYTENYTVAIAPIPNNVVYGLPQHISIAEDAILIYGEEALYWASTAPDSYMRSHNWKPSNLIGANIVASLLCTSVYSIVRISDSSGASIVDIAYGPSFSILLRTVGTTLIPASSLNSVPSRNGVIFNLDGSSSTIKLWDIFSTTQAIWSDASFNRARRDTGVIIGSSLNWHQTYHVYGDVMTIGLWLNNNSTSVLLRVESTDQSPYPYQAQVNIFSQAIPQLANGSYGKIVRTNFAESQTFYGEIYFYVDSSVTYKLYWILYGPDAASCRTPNLQLTNTQSNIINTYFQGTGMQCLWLYGGFIYLIFVGQRNIIKVPCDDPSGNYSPVNIAIPYDLGNYVIDMKALNDCFLFITEQEIWIFTPSDMSFRRIDRVTYANRHVYAVIMPGTKSAPTYILMQDYSGTTNVYGVYTYNERATALLKVQNFNSGISLV